MFEKTKYYDIYFDKLEKAGVSHESIEQLMGKYGAMLNSASFAMLQDNGLAYNGSLMEVTLCKLCVYAIKVNKLLPEDMQIPQEQIIKICLLQHISKAIRTEICTENWRIKRGEAYSYKALQPSIGTGLHSIAMCQECGIMLTPIEMEAMTCIDRADDDLQFKFHCNVLPRIVKIANDLVLTEAQKKNNMII